MLTKKVGLLMAVALLAVAVLAACQAAAPTEAPVAATEAPVVATEAPVVVTEAPVEITDTELNVLCTPQEEWCQGMKQEFEAKYGITVNYVRMSAGEALARIEAEKDAPTFDIWWGGPIDSFVAAKEKGLLEAYDSPNYVNLRDPELMKDPDNQWVGVYIGTLGFATNKEWLAAHPEAKAPTSWDDLLKPEFTGQVMVAHPSTSGTSYTALATILQIRGEEAGWEYIKQYAGQISQFTKSGAAPAKFVCQGEAAVAIVFSHDIVNEIENNQCPLELTFPAEGTGYEIGGMAILKGAKNIQAAKLWYDWELTPEGQSLGPKYHAYQAPTINGVELSHPELLEVNLIDYDFQWAGQNKTAFVDKFTNEIANAENLKQ
ncbi:MAG: ABC transporter substrate-binding protein [Anaerolineaceae bacterium]|nr:ABC transporter substrate-binding protein [Anaerolineaceae bacterium]